MRDERDAGGAPRDPWKDLPDDPWLRPGTIRVERETSLGKGELVAIIMSDPADPGDPMGPWTRHWLMKRTEPFPLNLVQGGELELRWIGSGTGDAATLGASGYVNEFPPGEPLSVRTLETQLTASIDV